MNSLEAHHQPEMLIFNMQVENELLPFEKKCILRFVYKVYYCVPVIQTLIGKDYVYKVKEIVYMYL